MNFIEDAILPRSSDSLGKECNTAFKTSQGGSKTTFLPIKLQQSIIQAAMYAASGNTEKAAQQVASIVSGDLHKIQPEKSYTSADLNWRDKSSRSSVEMDDPTSRPAIIDDLKNLAEYDTVYLGFPIWWNQAPRLINTFLEKYDLSGKTVIPFATSGSSNISNAESELRKAYPDVNWQKGKLMNGATEEDIKNWTKK